MARPIFTPHWVHQVSELIMGDTVSHEDYNEKLNLNSGQGDYNTHVLLHLFTVEDKEETYHIPYIDKELVDTNDRITAIEESLPDIPAITEILNAIIDGTTTVGHATLADNLTDAVSAGPREYYGTDYNSTVGFHRVPDSIYADDMSQQYPEIEGIYFTPRLNSVAENMLTQEVRDKLNAGAITSYNDLDDKPAIGGVTLNSNTTLSDLGIISSTDISNTYETKSDATLKYNTNQALANSKAQVFINTIPEGVTPNVGDLLVIV